MNLMHISLDLSVQKVFKNTRKGVACTGACLRLRVSQARIRRCQSRNNFLPDVPQVVAVKFSLLLPQLLPRFLNITIYIYKNECHVMLMRVQR
jgi:hypothetical protein